MSVAPFKGSLKNSCVFEISSYFIMQNVLTEFLREPLWILWCLQSEELLKFPHGSFSLQKMFVVHVRCLYTNKTLCKINACTKDYQSVIETVNITEVMEVLFTQ